MDRPIVARKFEVLISKIFKVEIKGVKLLSASLDQGVDFDIFQGDEKYGAEIKFYRSRFIAVNLLERAVIQLNQILKNQQYIGGFLFVTVNIETSIKETLIEKYGIGIIDRAILLSLTSKDEDLRNDLEGILLELSQSADENIYEGISLPIDTYSFRFLRLKNVFNGNAIKPGEILCRELNHIVRGRLGARGYEKKCEEILKYIFDTDFSNWVPQNQTTDTLHILDLIAKISSKNDVWRSLSRDFNSRFVVFEFKNYTSRIKQGQIYSTEKYLFTTALRSIAIILSREGADRNAEIAMQGALRESGKLIVNLNEIEICEMLKMKDIGGDPNKYLSEKIDIILMKLSR